MHKNLAINKIPTNDNPVNQTSLYTFNPATYYKHTSSEGLNTHILNFHRKITAAFPDFLPIFDTKEMSFKPTFPVNQKRLYTFNQDTPHKQITSRGLNAHILNLHIKNMAAFFDFLPIFDIVLAKDKSFKLTLIVDYLLEVIQSEPMYNALYESIKLEDAHMRPSDPEHKRVSYESILRNKTFDDFKKRAIQCLILIHELSLDTLVDWQKVSKVVPNYKDVSVNVVEEIEKDPFDISLLPPYMLKTAFSFLNSERPI